MFQIDYGNDGQIVCSGRLDAAQCEKAQAFMDAVAEARVLDFSALEYISSAGLGVLLKTQKRLVESGKQARKANTYKYLGPLED